MTITPRSPQDDPTLPRGAPEVLAPAGSRASLIAALREGADAVYLGIDEGFNARARAENFSLANLAATAEEIHRADAKLYVTLNTLVFEPELERLEEVVREVARAGADAIIVQDPAVAMIARELCPELRVHASTQMTVSTGAAAQFAKDLGICRVVVPRELSVYEIKRYAEDSPLPLEVFIHGALCVSWSGQCLTSEAWSGRSANRGQCAQSCRLPYSLIVDGEEKDLGDVRYLLSPKDLIGTAAVAALRDIGVASLKIEGRQKGPQYVATAVKSYRHLVDKHAVAPRNGETGHAIADASATADHLRDMSLSYTRGFSNGFLHGSDHQTLVEGRFPKHRGVYLGRVEAVRGFSVEVHRDAAGRPWTGALAADDAARRAGPIGETSTPLGTASHDISVEPAAGMGVVFDDDDPEDKAEAGGPLFSVKSTEGGWALGFGRPGPDTTRIRPGMRVWITSDPQITRWTERGVREGSPTGEIAVHVTVRGAVLEPLVVEARIVSGPRSGIAASVTSEMALGAARGAGLDETILRDKLLAFGGSAYKTASLDTRGLAGATHIPVKELKALRRALVAALDLARQRRSIHEAPVVTTIRTRLLESPGPNTDAAIIPLCRTDAQLDAAVAAGCQEVELDWMELVGLKRAAARAREAGLRVTLATLRVQKPGEEDYLRAICAAEPDAILVRHLAALQTLRDRPDRPILHGDFSLNATNSLTALHLLRQGLTTLTASFDLDEEQLCALLDRVPRGRIAVVVHHRVPAFHTEHCVYAHLLSNGRDYRTCGRPCESHEVSLKDDAGRIHPVIVDAGCRNTVFNSAAQSAALLSQRLLERGVRRFRVEFVREDAAEARKILDTWNDLLGARIAPDLALRQMNAKARLGVADAAMKLADR